MKNANGFGCVYKFNPKFKRLRKPWVAKVSINRIGERQQQKTLGYYATKAEAMQALIAYQKDPDLLENSKITVDDVYQMYYRDRQAKVSKSRLADIRSRYNCQFGPIKDKKIASLTPVMLQEFMDGIHRASATKQACKSVLRGIYRYALKMQIIKEDISGLVDIGKHNAVIERMVFSKKEIKYLWDNKDHFMAKQLLILIYTGMRINEYRSLDMKDYDVVNYTVRTGSKTEAGKDRLIPIHSRVRRFLFEMLESGTNKVVYSTFRYHLLKFIEDSKGKLRNHRVHDTRHTFASLMNTAGANEVALTKIIGHTDISTTNKVYTHKDIEELKAAVELLK